MLKDSLNDTSILEVGTGSGCIAITLALNTNATIVSIDVSELALKQAKTNAQVLSASVAFSKADILDDSTCESLGSFDVIVSNPPYIPIREKANMQEQVVGFEPSIALFVSNEDPLIFYRAIAKIGKQNLSKNGQLFFEIHYDQGKAILALLDELNYHAELRQDSFGKNRMIRASLK